MTDAPLFGPGFTDDPYPAYARLRAAGPVHRVTLPSGVEAYLVTRHADARRVLADDRLSKNPRHAEAAWRSGRVGLPGEHRSPFGGHLLNIDPPDHTRLRRLVSAAFTPRRVEAAGDTVRAYADELLDAVDADGRADLIAAYAFPLPILVISELLGVPAEDRAAFHAWASGMIAHGPGHRRGGVGRSVRLLHGYLDDLVRRKRAELATRRPTPRAGATARPGDGVGRGPDDLLTALILASDEGNHLSPEEVVSMAFILLFAGFETTVNLIGNGLFALLRHPDQLAAVRADPGLLPTAVEELLRYDGPVELATWRFTTEPISVGGTDIPAGEAVLVVLAAADRDPERFPDPDRLDIRRADGPHLAFGHGIHFCIGAPLARLEGRVALRTLLARFPDLALDADPAALRWRGGLIMRGLRTLPVRFTPTVPRIPPPGAPGRTTAARHTGSVR